MVIPHLPPTLFMICVTVFMADLLYLLLLVFLLNLTVTQIWLFRHFFLFCHTSIVILHLHHHIRSPLKTLFE